MCEFGDEPTLSEADGAQVTERERAFYRALLEYEPLQQASMAIAVDALAGQGIERGAAGGRILGAAVMGFTARDHAERHHPEQVDVYAEKAAPLFEPERAAWLFGYRWQP
jgi:hypothetical protein